MKKIDVTKHTGIVVKLSARYSTLYHNRLQMREEELREELVQDSFCALVRASEQYDPRRGEESTFAWTVVENAIMHRLNSFLSQCRDCANAVSMDKPLFVSSDGVEVTLSDMLPSKNIASAVQNLQCKERGDFLRRCMGLLNEKQRFVVERYYGIDGVRKESTERIVDHLGCSCVQVRQILQKALHVIRLFVFRNHIDKGMFL